MRPLSKLPDEGVNVSPSHPIREACVLVFGVCLVGLLVFVLIASSVELLAPLVPPKAEARLLAPIWEQIDEQMDAPTKAQAKEIAKLVNRLSAHWKDKPYDFRLGILEEDSPNAFALPGGAILVTSGLIAKAESENELAFVLGHELGHFRNRDHLKALGRGVLFNLLLSMVGMSGGEAVSLVGTTGLLTERHFSRDQESAADRFGLELVYKEYGHVAGGMDFFKRLPKEIEGSNLAKFADTHPVTAERVAELKQLAKEEGWTLEGELRVPIGKMENTKRSEE